jgi:hypothetical protein
VNSALGPLSIDSLLGKRLIVAEMSGADTQRLCDLIKGGWSSFVK